jgi:syntaxin 5
MLGATAAAGASVRDRTAEFQQIVARLQQQQGLPSTSGRDAPSAPASAAGAPQSEFARRAAKIGMGIHSTSQKLQKLAQLARRTSMFDDPAEEINELSTVVKQDIQALNQAISDLQTFSGGGPNKQSADHSHTVVDNLRSRLKDATQEFKDVLTTRTDNLKAHQERKSMFSAAPEGGAARQPLFSQPGASFLPPNARNPLAPAVRGGLQGGGSDESAPLLGGGSGGQQQQALMVPAQDQYMASRAEALHQVESTIVELGGIFQQLAHMVHEQGEMATRIDENVEDTLGNVDAGQAQLLKYLSAISSNRFLIMKVFAVLLCFMIFFIMFIA